MKIHWAYILPWSFVALMTGMIFGTVLNQEGMKVRDEQVEYLLNLLQKCPRL